MQHTFFPKGVYLIDKQIVGEGRFKYYCVYLIIYTGSRTDWEVK